MTPERRRQRHRHRDRQQHRPDRRRRRAGAAGAGAAGGGRTISSSTTGPVILAATDNPLTITSSGAVTLTGSGVDGIDGPANSAATIYQRREGDLVRRGRHIARRWRHRHECHGGSIAGLSAGVYGGWRAVSTVTNAGSIGATGSNGAGVYLAGGGGITNQAGGSISGAYIGVTILGGSGRVTNAGKISNGVYLAGGGSLTNSAGASTSGNNFGVFVGVGPGTITNAGIISSPSNNGVYLQAGGSVTNSNGATISGPGFGVAVSGGTGTVTNSGTISGGTDAVKFANSGADRLVVGPNAVFNGSVLGGSGSNTLELAGGKGSIAGLSGGSGTVTENGSWSFTKFGTVAVDPGGDWTLSGGTVANVSNNGTIEVAGSVDVSSAIDPASTGVFLLNGGAKLDIAAALGINTQIGVPGQQQRAADRQPSCVWPERGRRVLRGSAVAGFWGGRHRGSQAVRLDGSGIAVRSDERGPAGHEQRLAAREPVVSDLKPGRRGVP